MSLKRPKLGQAQHMTLSHLVVDLGAVIPNLSRDKAGLQSSAHTQDTGHKDAAILTDMYRRKAIDIPQLLSEGNIYTDYTDTQPSSLLDCLQNKPSLVYQNETEVQLFVMDALRDAIKLLGLASDLTVRPDISLFSDRPDSVVVTHSVWGIILVVEVKKLGMDVFTSHSVGGQIYDHLVGMLVRGVSRPLAVLSSYEQMVIAHLDDDGRSRQLLEQVAGAMGDDMADEISFLRRDDRSPLPNVNSVFSGVSHQAVKIAASDCKFKDTQDDDDVNDDDDDWNRALWYSKVVERDDILKSLLLASRCGIKSCMSSPRVPLPLQGDSPSLACIRVNETGMIWCDLPSTVVIDYHLFPGEPSDSFYLLRDLGKGSSGRAFLACNSGGKTVVAKFFLVRNNEAHRTRESAHVRQQQRMLLLEVRKEEATTEMRYWETVYGGTYSVRMMKLYGHWCLLLPYFDSLVSVEARKAALPRIRSNLEHFKRLKFRYKTEDIHWRHVGTRGENEICLFDFGSLEKCENAASIDVEAQLRILQDTVETP